MMNRKERQNKLIIGMLLDKETNTKYKINKYDNTTN